MASKNTLVFIIVLIALVLVAVYVITSHNKTGPITRTITTTQTTTIENQTQTNQTANSTTTVGQSFDCLSNLPTMPIKNGNFSTGTYDGWNATGGFGTNPFNLTQANIEGNYYNHTWEGYNGTYFATTYMGGISHYVGNLTSDPFLVTEPYLNFKIISPYNNLLYVEVYQDGVPFMRIHYNTYVSGNKNAPSTFMNATIPLETLLCQNVSIKVTAGVAGATPSAVMDYIAVGDFYLSKTVAPNAVAPTNQTIFAV
ncbi:MAG: hypothetical protein M1122_02410 [Candidatus Marsarchaeota archaeon]|jgi:hypothetical protein|nr:hypothetical protein [Candidatus Marsarchaeota archaeon]